MQSQEAGKFWLRPVSLCDDELTVSEGVLRRRFDLVRTWYGIDSSMSTLYAHLAARSIGQKIPTALLVPPLATVMDA